MYDQILSLQVAGKSYWLLGKSADAILDPELWYHSIFDSTSKFDDIIPSIIPAKEDPSDSSEARHKAHR